MKRRHFATRLHVTSRKTSWSPLVRVISLRSYRGLFRLNVVLWVTRQRNCILEVTTLQTDAFREPEL